ncbi:probable RNA-binding protein EIF1AD [Brienomyrus brachyistius]|uniref:probable RNA-binding protein EIF1AD n=1 Tax=Brienomyrus brachyistius TaxID=42636 RepID=UPI0020B2AB6C|nr:probable RNA-binding protein EIF1AD [Brienomyrus brachyistius]XP_048883826.1 probable RNA-binding protein EIF1AD [Brienomyrus brachyistius]
MSQATKRKHVVKEVLGDFITPTKNQQIVRVVGSPGNNLHEAITAQGERYLVSMPTKFRKNIWIKRGDFVIVDPIEEGEKVKGEISAILYKDHIRHLQAVGVWPKGFSQDSAAEERREEQQRRDSKADQEEDDGGETSGSEDDTDLFVNTNRMNYQYSESEEETDEEEEEEENETDEKEDDESSSDKTI